MKCFRHYFPLAIISVLLHALLLFSIQQEKTIRITPFISGKQSIKVQLVNVTVTKNKMLKTSAHETQHITTDIQRLSTIQIKKEKVLKKKKTIRPPKPLILKKKSSKQKNSKHSSEKEITTKTTKNENSVLFNPGKTQGTLQKSQVISGKQPTYPTRARLRSQQGTVIIRFIVNTNGSTQDAKIIKSSGYQILDASVMSFIQKELFIVAVKGDTKVSNEQVFTFRFELK